MNGHATSGRQPDPSTCRCLLAAGYRAGRRRASSTGLPAPSPASITRSATMANTPCWTAGQSLAVRKGYVPDMLAVGEDGEGDYIILEVGSDGQIQDWQPPHINPTPGPGCHEMKKARTEVRAFREYSRGCPSMQTVSPELLATKGAFNLQHKAIKSATSSLPRRPLQQNPHRCRQPFPNCKQLRARACASPISGTGDIEREKPCLGKRRFSTAVPVSGRLHVVQIRRERGAVAVARGLGFPVHPWAIALPAREAPQTKACSAFQMVRRLRLQAHDKRTTEYASSFFTRHQLRARQLHSV